MQESIATGNRFPSKSTGWMGFPALNARSMVAAGFCIAGLYFANLYSFLLFHVLIEIFSVIVAFAIFMFAWNSRDKIHNSSLILLGAAYIAIGVLDLLHTFSYKGMGVFQTYGANTATQLWITARYMESLTLATVPLLVGRNITMSRALGVYAGMLTLVIATVFIWPVFPTCFVDEVGLTPFKKISEYIIAAILLLGLANLVRRKDHFDPAVFRMLAVSLIFTIASELMFTFYISVYGISNLMGHLLKLGSFWLIYKAIIETGLQKPYALLFRELARSEKRFRDLIDTLPTGVCEIDPDLQFTYVNPAGLKIIGYDHEDLQAGINLDMILDDKGREKAKARLNELTKGRPLESTGYDLLRKDGTTVEVIVNTSPVFRDGALKTIQVSLTDVTEFNRLQRCLQQARKMEAVGILAGGMAHEINNVLMGVVGGIEVIKFNALKKDAPAVDYATVLAGCDRIAGLVRQLLAYSRGGRYRCENIDWSAYLPKTLKEIEAALNPAIHLTCDIAAGLPGISADPTQLKMVITEIVTNAAEAIDGTGRIDIELQAREIDDDQARQRPGLQPGRYVLLRVRDTGKGMDAETVQHIFEPFFSKHFPGRGLGMAAVYGIVKNHGGWIGVASQVCQGTTVRILLPVHDAASHTEGIQSSARNRVAPSDVN